MYRILTASADCYITNKIIQNGFRATDGNTGQAGTLDLFKLYSESTISGSDFPIELSRALIKFDLDALREMTSSILDPSNMNVVLNMTDVYGGQTVPTNFILSILPLSKSFDEGFGRDLVEFQDLDSANWITASYTSTLVPWDEEGAGASGSLGDASIDIMDAGDLGSGAVSLESTQTFSTGEEDLFVDVTTVVSAALVGIIPDHGFRIAFSGSQETDDQTRFVKRFISRHSTNITKAPKLLVRFDDSTQDDRDSFFFDVSGSLFLNNYQQGVPASIVSGSSLTSITGTNCMLLTLLSGTFTQSYNVSQHSIGSNFVNGLYSATLAIPSVDSNLVDWIKVSGSAEFTEVWGSLDGTISYLSSSLTIMPITPLASNRSQRRLEMNVTNCRSEYEKWEVARFRVYAFDYDEAGEYLAAKVPIEAKSIVLKDVHYRVRDFNSNDLVIPFDTTYSSTKMSVDSNGMYFDFYMDSLPPGRVYKLEMLVRDRGIDQIISSVGGKFRVNS
jgi:hypothetical protein